MAGYSGEWPPGSWRLNQAPVDTALLDPYGLGNGFGLPATAPEQPPAPAAAPVDGNPLVANPDAPLGVSYDWPPWSDAELAAPAAPAVDDGSMQRGGTPAPGAPAMSPANRAAPMPQPPAPELEGPPRSLAGPASGKNAPAGPSKPLTYEEQLAQQTREEEGLIRDIGEIDAAEAQTKAQYAKQAADEHKRLMEENRNRELERQRALNQRYQQLEAERVELSNAKIDPNKWFHDQGTGGQVAWALTAGLAGMLSVSNGGKNSVLDAMQSAIERDLMAQKENIANKRASFGDSLTLYQELRQRYGDENTADAAYMMVAMDQIGKQALAAGLEYGTPRARANSEALALAARARGTEALNRAAQARAEADEKAARLALDQRQVGIQAYNARTSRMNVEADTRQQEWQREQAMKAAMEGDPKLRIRAGGEVVGAAATEEEAKAANNYIRGYRMMRAHMAEGRKLAEQGAAWTPTERKRRFEQWNRKLVLIRKGMHGDTSALNDGDWAAWGIDTTAAYPMASLDQIEHDDRVYGKTLLNESGMSDDDVTRLGIGDPTGARDADEGGNAKGNLQGYDGYEPVETDYEGRPLSGEEAEWERKRREEWEKRSGRAPSKITAVEWKYRRQQNDHAAMQGKPIPFPEVGVSNGGMSTTKGAPAQSWEGEPTDDGVPSVGSPAITGR